MKITEINRMVLRNLCPLIEKSLDEINNKLEGAKISLKNGGTYCSDNANIKLELALENNGQVISKEVTDYNIYAKRLGLPTDGIGRIFKSWDGNKYRVTGLKPRSKKYPVLACNLKTGKNFKFPTIVVISGLEK